MKKKRDLFLAWTGHRLARLLGSAVFIVLALANGDAEAATERLSLYCTWNSPQNWITIHGLRPGEKMLRIEGHHNDLPPGSRDFKVSSPTEGGLEGFQSHMIDYDEQSLKIHYVDESNQKLTLTTAEGIAIGRMDYFLAKDITRFEHAGVLFRGARLSLKLDNREAPLEFNGCHMGGQDTEDPSWIRSKWIEYIHKFDPTERRWSEQLLLAAEKGNLEKLQEALEKGASIDYQRSPYHVSALMVAVIEGQEEAVTFLLQKGANVNLQDGKQNTALFYAVKDAVILDKLLKAGAQVNLGNASYPPLRSAIETKHPDSVVLLVKAGADLNYRYSDGKNLLMLAIETRSREIVNYLLSLNHFDLNERTRDGSTVLHFTGYDLEILRSLLEKGASPNFLGGYGNLSPLMKVIDQSFIDDSARYEAIQLLLRAGADPNLHNGEWTPLIMASSKGYLNIIKLLVQYGGKVNLLVNNQTALTAALERSTPDPETVLFLLDKGADPNPATSVAPLIKATSADSLTIVQALISKGADPNKRISTGENALFFVKSTPVTLALLAAGVRADAINQTGGNSLFRALNLEVAQTLLEAGVDPLIRDRYNRTPLFFQHNTDVLDFLLARGVDLKVKDINGRSAASWQLENYLNWPMDILKYWAKKPIDDPFFEQAFIDTGLGYVQESPIPAECLGSNFEIFRNRRLGKLRSWEFLTSGVELHLIFNAIVSEALPQGICPLIAHNGAFNSFMDRLLKRDGRHHLESIPYWALLGRYYGRYVCRILPLLGRKIVKNPSLVQPQMTIYDSGVGNCTSAFLNSIQSCAHSESITEAEWSMLANRICRHRETGQTLKFEKWVDVQEP